MKQHRLSSAAFLFIALITLAAATVGVNSVLRRPSIVPFQHFTITRLTATGKVASAAISPDGRFVLSVLNDNGLQSLWLRNIPTSSDTQVFPPWDTAYLNVRFSPDGNQLYFRKPAAASGVSVSELYRVPVLGGTPQKIVHDIDSDIAFSPDGHRIAFIRQAGDKFSFLTSTVDGKDEQVAQTVRGLATQPIDNIAWDPGRNRVNYSLPQVNDAMGAIDVLDLGNGKAQRFATFKDKLVGQLSWLPNGEGILLQYAQKGPNIATPQIGFLSGNGKEFQPITRDADSYGSLTVSGDGRSLAAVQVRSKNSFYLLASSVRESPETTPPALSAAKQFSQFTWTSDGNLVTSDGARLWKIGRDGGNESQLLGDDGAIIRNVAACGSEHLLISWQYHQGANSTNIWRVNADGSGEVKLTDGRKDRGPVCSPDHKWVYYYDDQAISRVPLDGSRKPEFVLRSAPAPFFIFVNPMSLSPNGETLACTWVNSKTGETKLAIVDLKSVRTPKLRDVNPHFAGRMCFTPDGKSIYKVIAKNAANIWVELLDGSVGHQITKFLSGDILEFRWSPDGKTLGILRKKSESDVVLLQETK